MADARDPVPLIIGGCHRSGTTLLQQRLNRHPRIFCPPEIKFHRDLLGDYGEDPLAHVRLGRTIASLGLEREVWLDEFGRALVRCYELAAAAHGKARWADKNPENVLNAAHWDRLLGGRMHFVLVLRHPLDVIASMIETPMPRTIEQTDPGRARHLRAYVEAGLAFAERHPGRSAILRYEDLVADPRATFARLLADIGERFDEAMLAETEPERDGLGDPKARRRRGVSAESVGRWRRDLTQAQAEALQTELGDLISRLGYQV